MRLTGQGPFAVRAVQASHPCDTCDIIACLALQALWQLPGTGIDSNLSVAKILQAPAELLMQFLDRLQATLSWRVNSDEARVILLQLLAFTNANKDCRKALLTVHNPHTCDIADMVRACQNVGTTAYNTNSLAVALTAHFHVQTRGRGSVLNVVRCVISKRIALNKGMG